jgi:hypothetical protein
VIKDRKEIFEGFLFNLSDDELLQFAKITEKLANAAADL